MSPFVSVRFLATQSDARLLALARRGHERAFEGLVHRYRRPLLAHCRRLLGSEARAEDALQQGLMQAWLALQQDTEVREVRPWLYRIVHNASLNLIRARADTAALEDWAQSPAAPEADVERRLAVREALAGVAALPALQREALLRTALDGHSHEQVAAALGLSDGAVRGLVYRARATLRAGLTALTPPPVAAWVASTARPATPLATRLAELAGGGGSAGAAAVLLKGGAAAVTAGALVAGVAAPVVHLTGHGSRTATAARRAASANATPPASTSAAALDGTPGPRQALADSGGRYVRRPALRFPAATASPDRSSSGGDRGSRSGEGSGGSSHDGGDRGGSSGDHGGTAGTTGSGAGGSHEGAGPSGSSGGFPDGGGTDGGSSTSGSGGGPGPSGGGSDGGGSLTSGSDGGGSGSLGGGLPTGSGYGGGGSGAGTSGSDGFSGGTSGSGATSGSGGGGLSGSGSSDDVSGGAGSGASGSGAGAPTGPVVSSSENH